jgi:aspartate/tyrosine/aromatic aminotransferase
MKIIVGEWFWIPRVEGDIFKKIVKKNGLKYNNSKGFQTTSETDLKDIVTILNKALDEEVVMMLKCFICSAQIDCSNCRYSDACESISSFQKCLCEECETNEVSNIYSMRFTELAS